MGKMVGTQSTLGKGLANTVVNGSIVDMLNIQNDLIHCTWMLGVVHV
jgi:hypothetical protein